MDTQNTVQLHKFQPTVFGSSISTSAIKRNGFTKAGSLELIPTEGKLLLEVNHNILETGATDCDCDLNAQQEKTRPELTVTSLDSNLSEEATPFIPSNKLSTLVQSLTLTSDTSVELSEDLALELEQQGKYREALEMYLKLTTSQESNYTNSTTQSVDGPSIKLRNNMAIVYCRLGKYTEAAEIFSSILKIIDLEESNKMTANKSEENTDNFLTKHAVKNNLALVFNLLGMFDQSLQLFEEILKVREATLKDNHPEILATKHNIALVLNNQGKTHEALKMNEQVLSLREEALGPDHLDTLSTKLNMASVITSLGDYEIALNHLHQVLDKQEILLGPDHPQTLKTSHNIALVLSCQQKWIQALHLNKEIIDKRQKILGKDHPETLTTMHNAALALHAQSNYRRPLRKHKMIAQELQKIFPQNPNHPFILTNDLNLASVLVSQRNYEKALRNFETVIEKQGETSWGGGMDHPDTRVANFNKAGALISLKRFEEAAQVYGEINGKCDKEFCGEGLKSKQVSKQLAQCQEILKASENASVWSKLFHFICG